MAKLNWNRPNNGYEREPWQKEAYNQTKKSLNKAIYQEEVFISGKYWNNKISDIVDRDPRYCDWILENQPSSKVAKQIIRYFNKNHK